MNPSAPNAIQRWLDAAALPWRETRRELIERFGLTQCAWFEHEVVLLDVAPPPLPGLLRPMAFRQENWCDPAVPPTLFCGTVWESDDAMRNLKIAAERFAVVLGPGTREDHTTNARGFSWRFGRSCVRLCCFPRKLQTIKLENDSHRREPRLITGCDVRIETGYLPSCSPQELEWIERFVKFRAIDADLPRPPVAASKPAGRSWFDWLFGKKPPESPPPSPESFTSPEAIRAAITGNQTDERGLPFFREPPASVHRVFGSLGASPDGGTLIFCNSTLCLVPKSDVQSVGLGRLLPGRGGGNGFERIELICRSPGMKIEIPLHLMTGGLHGLDDVAGEIARWIGCPLMTGETIDD